MAEETPNRPPDRGRGEHSHWWDDGELARRRLGDQVEIVLSRLPGSAAYRPDHSPDTVEYLYREGRILVHDADLDRVSRVVDGFIPDGGALINGVTAYSVSGMDTPTALAQIDAALGIGVAAPDHVLWVTPRSCCPATEPALVSAGTGPSVFSTAPGHATLGAGAVVSVVDTGFISSLVNPAHPWLAGVTGDEEHFDPNDIGPYVGHGTFIAGIVRGVAPRTEIHVDGFLTDGGAVYESVMIAQLNEALDRMPDIISMSAGCTTRGNRPPLAFEALWQHRLRHYKGTVLVAAAGNDASRTPFWPAASPWAVSVGALDPDGSRAPYSNFGSWVDVYALGTDVVNAYPNGVFKYQEAPHVGEVATFTDELCLWSGTSFSTPLVSGMIAARMSQTGQSARRAADSVLAIARAHATPGIGAIAEAGMACDRDPYGP